MLLKLLINRVTRTYTGGKLLDQWQGTSPGTDGNLPEEWVASATEAINEVYIENEGLSRIADPGREGMLLRDFIRSNPRGILGEDHFRIFGDNPGVLVKVLDSACRLTIQVHPDKEFARDFMHSRFGKTEAWYIVGGRVIDGEKPYVLFSFKPGITREYWQSLFKKQDIQSMKDCLHRFEVKPGDVFLIEGGIPHAAGAGVFFIEIQEPTDYTIRTEKKNLAGRDLAPLQIHQGTGYDKMFGCFHYDGFTREELLEKWFIRPSVKTVRPGGRELFIISPERTPVFSMTRLEVSTQFVCGNEETFVIALVLEGKGRILQGGTETSITRGEELFFTANSGEIKFINDGEGELVVIRCFPPSSGEV